MFNTYSPTQKVNVVSGTLLKTCKDSYFQCCQRGGKNFDDIVNKGLVVILQAMIMSNDYVMFEVISQKDFEKIAENYRF